MVGRSFAAGFLVFVLSLLAIAPEDARADTEVQPTGRNVIWVDVPTGGFVSTGTGQWAEKDAQGNTAFMFRETGRDDWSVYLHDDSRNVQLQLDLHRKMILYGTDGGPKRDLYPITATGPVFVVPDRIETPWYAKVIGTLGADQVIVEATEVSVTVANLSTGKFKTIARTTNRIGAPDTFATQSGFTPSISANSGSRFNGSFERIAADMLEEIRSTLDTYAFEQYETAEGRCSKSPHCDVFDLLRLRAKMLAVLGRE